MESVATFPAVFWTSYAPSQWFDVTELPLLATQGAGSQSTPNFSVATGPSDLTPGANKHINLVALVLLPLVLIFGLVGNALVCIAVFRFTPLRIVANYFIVSLAVADMAVCGIIMPLAAVQELSGEWRLGSIMCDVWVCIDVLMSTASIWNLCVIALDRYMAITRPVWYALRRTSLMAMVAITVTWVLSLLVSIPALIFVGGYDEAMKNLCVLNISPVFAIISSMVSFYIPCVVVLVVYQRILVAARHHSRRRVRPTIMSVSTVHQATAKASTRGRNTTGSSGACSSSANSSIPPLTQDANNTNNSACASHSETQASVSNLESAANLTQSIPEETNQHDNHQEENAATNDAEPASADDERAGCLAKHHAEDGASNIDVDDAQNANGNLTVPTQTKRVTLITDDGPTVAANTSPTAYNPHAAFVRRRQISVTRERRAAFVLAIVVGVFICCWLPFFIINVVLGICPSCPISPVAFQVVTWLGWCNSILNPIIYTTFNRDFRNAFKKIIFCGKI